MRLFKRYVVKDYVVICLVEFEHIVVEQQRVAFDNVFSVHGIILSVCNAYLVASDGERKLNILAWRAPRSFYPFIIIAYQPRLFFYACSVVHIGSLKQSRLVVVTVIVIIGNDVVHAPGDNHDNDNQDGHSKNDCANNFFSIYKLIV